MHLFEAIPFSILLLFLIPFYERISMFLVHNFYNLEFRLILGEIKLKMCSKFFKLSRWIKSFLHSTEMVLKKHFK